jgi:hypothetical protein
VKVVNPLFIFNDTYMPGLELATQVANSDPSLGVDVMADEAPRELSTYCLYFQTINVLNHLSPDPLPNMPLFTGH